MWSLKVPSVGVKNYFLTFIDDFSKNGCLCFLKEKSDACDIFKHSDVEKWSELKSKHS